MASEILGLFTTPEQYQQNQLAQFQNRAATEVQMSPFQQAALGARTAGYQLGQGIGGALGGQDPQLQLIARRQQLASQLDPTNLDTYKLVAQDAANRGDTQFAMAVADAGRQAAIQIAQANKERQLAVPPDIQKLNMLFGIQDNIRQYKLLPQSAERDDAIKILEERLKVIGGESATKLAVPIQVANRIGEINRTLRTLKPEDPTYQDLVDEKAQLERPEKPEKVADKLQVAKRVREIQAQLSPETGVVLPPQVRAGLEAELGSLQIEQKPDVPKIGIAEGTGEAVYYDRNEDLQFIKKRDPKDPTKQIRVPFEGRIDQYTSKVSASSSSQQETEFSKDLGKADAERVKNAMNTRENAIGSLNSLNRLNELNQQDLISGSFATGRVGATNLLVTLGLASGKDVGKLSDSENYQKTAGDLILSTLGGKLGAGFSNEDREFIKSLVPQLENSPQARKQLIEFMVKKNQGIVDETTRLENYARDNKSLKGYVPKIPIINLQGGSNKPVDQMTKQELINAIEAKKRQPQ